MYHPQCGPYSRAIIDSAPPVLSRQFAIVGTVQFGIAAIVAAMDEQSP
jgi:hypothetical protein